MTCLEAHEAASKLQERLSSLKALGMSTMHTLDGKRGCSRGIGALSFVSPHSFDDKKSSRMVFFVAGLRRQQLLGSLEAGFESTAFACITRGWSPTCGCPWRIDGR